MSLSHKLPCGRKADAVLGEQPVAGIDEFAKSQHADMFKHADRDNPVERALQCPIVLKVEAEVWQSASLAV